MVDIYGDAKRRSKYPQLATDNEGTTVESRFFKSLRETEIDSNRREFEKSKVALTEIKSKGN